MYNYLDQYGILRGKFFQGVTKSLEKSSRAYSSSAHRLTEKRGVARLVGGQKARRRTTGRAPSTFALSIPMHKPNDHAHTPATAVLPRVLLCTAAAPASESCRDQRQRSSPCSWAGTRIRSWLSCFALGWARSPVRASTSPRDIVGADTARFTGLSGTGLYVCHKSAALERADASLLSMNF